MSTGDLGDTADLSQGNHNHGDDKDSSKQKNENLEDSNKNTKKPNDSKVVEENLDAKDGDKEDPQREGNKGGNTNISDLEDQTDEEETITYGIDVAKWQESLIGRK